MSQLAHDYVYVKQSSRGASPRNYIKGGCCMPHK